MTSSQNKVSTMNNGEDQDYNEGYEYIAFKKNNEIGTGFSFYDNETYNDQTFMN